MEGYGFPADLEPRLAHDGWWPSQDTGSLDASGSLTLAGRLDDGFKTAAGALVNPAEVGAVLMFHPAVVDAMVTPLPAAGGAMIGAVVETGSTRVNAHQLHAFVSPLLPPWSRPHVIVVTDRLPRLTTGKIDQAACLELLRRGQAS
jgi:acyl-coenzyme A synthetase/AMP-(fatty) acid ligase